MRILVRSGMTPLDTYSAEDIFLKDRTGFNNGNLAYQYSIYRTLWTEDVEMSADGLASNPNLATFINENYDAYIIPLADAFRDDFRPILRNYTHLIKQLHIPVVVIGVGLRADYEPNLEQEFSFDEDVKNFVAAVLAKSNQIGVRGQITADYLKKLGFQEEIDYRVIGCPSLYTFGKNLHIREVKLDPNMRFAINASPTTAESALQFIHKTVKGYPNYYFIPQHLDEFYLLFASGQNLKMDREDYPSSIAHKFYQEGRVRYFTNMPSWLQFMRETSFSFGARLHGNVIATLAGTPNISFVQDARMRELASYHCLPHVTIDQLNAISDLENLLTNVDLKSAEKVQNRNFNSFIDFLNSNQIDHIYAKDRYAKVAPLDEKMVQLSYPESALPVTSLNKNELLERMNTCSYLLEERNKVRLNYHNKVRNDKINALTKQLQVSKGQLKKSEELNKTLEKQNILVKKDLANELQKNQQLSEENEYFKGTLNRKSIKLTLRMANRIANLKKK